MRRYLKSTVAALLAIIIIFASYVPVIAVGQPSSYSTKYNSGQRDVVCTTLDGTSADAYYYGSYEYDVLSEKSSTEVLNSLRTLMRTTHTYTTSYDECHYLANRSDCENENGKNNKLSLIYTSYEATMSQWNGWNREHVWPKSLGGNNTTGGGADLHHIRPSDAVVNSTRGNKKYGNANGGKAVYGSNPASGVLGGYSSTYYEPLDNVKGDVARICLYVYVRWGSQWGADSITEVFQSVDVLLEWCEMDPVDTWEMGRNEVVEDIQGNRNVFIDYPEYAWLIFGREVPSDMQTPSGEALESGNQGGGNQGGDPVVPHEHTFVNGKCACGAEDPNYTPDIPDPVCTHTNTELRYQVAPNCTNDGYTGDIYCSDCNKLLSYGSQIEPDDTHEFGSWELNDDGSYVRHCARCGASQSLTVNALVASIDNDAEKILILLSLGVTDSALLESLSN